MCFFVFSLKVGDSTDAAVSPPEIPKYLTYGKKKAGVRERLKEADLFTLYNMLNSVKVDLLWGRNDGVPTEDDGDLTPIVETEKLLVDEAQAATTNNTTTTTTINLESSKVVDSQNQSQQSAATATATTHHQLSVTGAVSDSTASGAKGHIRRPSTVSTISTNSAASTISDTDSEVSNENDSGIESESNQERDKSIELEKQFRTHLHGLYKCLEQMTDAANYLTVRYQNDVGTV